MIIDLKKYFLSESLADTIEYELDLSSVEINGVKPFSVPVNVKVTLRGFAGSVVLKAQVHYTVVAPCDRCCEETALRKAVDFSHILVRELGEEDSDEYLFVPEARLDLDELLTEDILLDLPGKFLCKEDCKGLCPRCGANLNLGKCSCEPEETDPRLEALRALLQDS